jgi:hypothetical protein
VALVVLGALVQGLSGQIGGTVFHSGKRAGVVSRAACKVKVCSASQAARRDAFSLVARAWSGLDPDVKVSWERWAAGHTWPNKLSVLRSIGGKAAYCAWALGSDPSGTSAGANFYPPSEAACEAPIVESVSFTAGGPFNMTFSNAMPSGGLMQVFCTRHLEYGPRGGRGMGKWLGTESVVAGANNYYSFFVGSGYDLASGEKVRLNVYWYIPLGWPSFRVSVLTTVA